MVRRNTRLKEFLPICLCVGCGGAVDSRATPGEHSGLTRPFCKPLSSKDSILVCEDFDQGLDDVMREGWTAKLASPAEMIGFDTSNPVSPPNVMRVVTSDGWLWMNGLAPPWIGILTAAIPPGVREFTIEFSLRAKLPGSTMG